MHKPSEREKFTKLVDLLIEAAKEHAHTSLLPPTMNSIRTDAHKHLIEARQLLLTEIGVYP